MENSSGTQEEFVKIITVPLIGQADADLTRLHEKTGLSITDLVNRAAALYWFIESEIAAGREVLIADPGTGKSQKINLQ